MPYFLFPQETRGDATVVWAPRSPVRWPRGRQGVDGNQRGRDGRAGEWPCVPEARGGVGLPMRALPSGVFFI